MKNYNPEKHKMQLRMIKEMIDASIELSVKKGPHPLTKGCNCIACVNKRKAIMFKQDKEWKYTL